MDENEVFQEHITVDLTGCKYVMEFWERIKLGFGFQEHFGTYKLPRTRNMFLCLISQ